MPESLDAVSKERTQNKVEAVPQKEMPLSIKSSERASNKISAKDLVDALMGADERTKEVLRKTLGAGKGVGKRKANKKSKQRALAHRIVREEGESVQAEGFLPIPPDSIIEKGPEYVEAYLHAWEKGTPLLPDAVDIEEEVGEILGELGMSLDEVVAEAVLPT